jgi:hypothetical protein
MLADLDLGENGIQAVQRTPALPPYTWLDGNPLDPPLLYVVNEGIIFTVTWLPDPIPHAPYRVGWVALTVGGLWWVGLWLMVRAAVGALRRFGE